MSTTRASYPKLPNMNEGGRKLASMLMLHDIVVQDLEDYQRFLYIETLASLLWIVDPKRHAKMCAQGIL